MMTSTTSASWASAPLGRVAAPIREQVTDRLREAITSLQLEPGARLVERELMENLGVSRTTVREAIRQLAAEGLVTVVPQRGAVVARTSRTEAVDLYDIRAALESMVVKRFIERATDDEHEALRAACRGYRDASETRPDDVDFVISAKDAIYTVLLAGARSAPLEQLIENLQARVHVLRTSSLSHSGRTLEAVREMEAVVDAIGDRDLERATAAYVHHIRNAAATALSDFTD
jgi:DNA-binding GntR family transcriptional regulator